MLVQMCRHIYHMTVRAENTEGIYGIYQQTTRENQIYDKDGRRRYLTLLRRLSATHQQQSVEPQCISEEDRHRSVTVCNISPPSTTEEVLYQQVIKKRRENKCQTL